MAKKKIAPDGIVYSTSADFKLGFDGLPEQDTIKPRDQKLLIVLDSRQRAGKAVTLVQGFVGRPGDLEELAKKLKTYCGVGGSSKEGEIIVQGDQRTKVLQWLLKNDFIRSKSR